jgi:hypothetical protein
VHAAPPVRVTLGRSGGWVAFTAYVGGLAAANLSAWLALQAGLSAGVPWIGLAAGVSGALVTAAWAWQRQAPGTLDWDGLRWQWAGRDGDVRVEIDLGRWMLLRFSAESARHRWIALSRRQAEGPWPALRAALYSRRPADPSSDAPPA